MLRKVPVCLILVTLPSLTALAFQLAVLLTGLDSAKPVVLLVGGVERPLGDVGPSGDVTIALDPNLDTALDPNKNYAVYRTSCNRYVIVVQGSDDERRCRRDNENAKADESCGRCVPVGVILKGRYTTVTSAAASAGAAVASGGFSLGAFGFASSKQTMIINADTGVPIIDGRFNAANYDQPRDIQIDEKGSGLGWGGGVNLAWGGVPIGMRVGFTHEQERSSPTETVRGRRALNGLMFEQFGDARLGSTTLFVGPTIHIPGGIVVTGGPAVSWWQVDSFADGQPARALSHSVHGRQHRRRKGRGRRNGRRVPLRRGILPGEQMVRFLHVVHADDAQRCVRPDACPRTAERLEGCERLHRRLDPDQRRTAANARPLTARVQCVSLRAQRGVRDRPGGAGSWEPGAAG